MRVPRVKRGISVSVELDVYFRVEGDVEDVVYPVSNAVTRVVESTIYGNPLRTRT